MVFDLFPGTQLNIIMCIGSVPDIPFFPEFCRIPTVRIVAGTCHPFLSLEMTVDCN